MKKLILLLLILILPCLCFAGHLDKIKAVIAKKNSTVSAGGVETIGVETPGASSAVLSAGFLIISGLDVAAHSGVFQTISMYFSCNSYTTDIKLGIYAGATYSTATLVGYVEWLDPGVLSAGWQTIDVSAQNWTATAGTSYWLGFVANGTSFTYYYDDGADGSSYYKSQVYDDTWVNPYDTATTSTKLRSIKATIAY